jgi:hypothetical protein
MATRAMARRAEDIICMAAAGLYSPELRQIPLLIMVKKNKAAAVLRRFFEGPQAPVFYIGARSSPTLLNTKLGTPMKLDKVEVLAKFRGKQSGTWVPTAQKTSPPPGVTDGQTPDQD